MTKKSPKKTFKKLPKKENGSILFVRGIKRVDELKAQAKELGYGRFPDFLNALFDHYLEVSSEEDEVK